MFYTILEFKLGQIFLAKTNKGLSFATYMKNKSRFKEISRSFEEKNIPLIYDPKKFTQESKLFDSYFKGKKEDFTSLPLDFVSGTPTQRKVWLEARKIPYGETKPYKSLASKLGHRGYRSIGQAMSRNPLLVVIPCHRVVSADGGLGGFSAGLKLKKFLLGLERGDPPA